MTGPTREWITIPVPGKERKQWQIDVTFLMSSWRCIFGQGCQGVLTEPAPEMVAGLLLVRRARVREEGQGQGREAREAARRRRVAVQEGRHEEGRVERRRGKDEWRTRLVQGCVRIPQSSRLRGRARLRVAPARDEHRASTSARPSRRCAGSCRCARSTATRKTRSVTSVLTEFGRDGWGEGGEEFAWWCTEAPEAFTGARARLQADGNRAAARCSATPSTKRSRSTGRSRLDAGPPPMPHPAEVPVSLGRTAAAAPVVGAWRELARARRRSRGRTARAAERSSRDIDPDAWLRPTPAWGWDVRDTIAHLADTDEMAIATAHADRPDRSMTVAAARARPARTSRTAACCAAAAVRRPSVGMVGATTAARARAARGSSTPTSRVSVGHRDAPAVVRHGAADGDLGARARRARRARRRAGRHRPTRARRLARDARAALRVLASRARAARRTPLRVELTLPSGAQWTFGPADGADRITGLAGEYCRVFVHRLPLADTTSSRAEGTRRGHRALSRAGVPVLEESVGRCRCSRSRADAAGARDAHSSRRPRRWSAT